jgi:DNA-binding MarR family transcriptional regulator
MAIKQYLKKSEAKILVYLNQVDNRLKYKTMISNKLGIDYGYLMRILNNLESKQWIRSLRSHSNKVFYELTKKAPLQKAKDLLVE